MGLDYHIFCADCGVMSHEVEFSIVGYIQLKHPDEAGQDLEIWTEFLVKHNNHRIQFVDGRGNQTDPSKTTGGYVLGLHPYEEGPAKRVRRASARTES